MGQGILCGALLHEPRWIWNILSPVEVIFVELVFVMSEVKLLCLKNSVAPGERMLPLLNLFFIVVIVGQVQRRC